MSDYTPTTDVIHAAYLACTDWESWAAYEGKNISELSKERDAEFDRWLAEVKVASMTSERNHLVRLVEHEQEVMRKAGGATFGKRKEYDEGYNMALRDIRGILERGE